MNPKTKQTILEAIPWIALTIGIWFVTMAILCHITGCTPDAMLDYSGDDTVISTESEALR